MSTTPKRPATELLPLAERIVAELRPHCHRIEIAGADVAGAAGGAGGVGRYGGAAMRLVTYEQWEAGDDGTIGRESAPDATARH